MLSTVRIGSRGAWRIAIRPLGGPPRSSGFDVELRRRASSHTGDEPRRSGPPNLDGGKASIAPNEARQPAVSDTSTSSSSPSTPSTENATTPRPGQPIPLTATPLLSPHISPTRSSTRLQAYAPRLTALSRRTGVPFASLAGSFMVLHELTALVPLVVLFFVFQAVGAGAGIVSWLESVRAESGAGVAGTTGGEDWERRLATSQKSSTDGTTVGPDRWKIWVRTWMDEAEDKIARVGKRYGILGYDKVEKGGATADASSAISATAAGATENVANAIAAYVVVKALLPVRIGLSLALAPPFARFALYPIRRLLGRIKPAPPK